MRTGSRIVARPNQWTLGAKLASPDRAGLSEIHDGFGHRIGDYGLNEALPFLQAKRSSSPGKDHRSRARLAKSRSLFQKSPRSGSKRAICIQANARRLQRIIGGKSDARQSVALLSSEVFAGAIVAKYEDVKASLCNSS